MATKLSSQNLKTISNSIKTPSYDRSELSTGIVHFGVGNFHRAHQAVYLNSLFDSGHNQDWAIIGTGVLTSDEVMRQALADQDYLTTVVEQSAGQSRACVTGAMIDFLSPDDPAAIIHTLSQPAIRIVSLTITEGGYFIDPATGVFDDRNPEIVADGTNPEKPKTVFGLIAAGLRQRRSSGVEPFTVMSCDNIPHNGVVTRNAVAGLTKLSDPGFSKWIIDHVSFPNGMVDRITAVTGDRQRDILAREFGIEDNWPVFCEDFIQWVLEDNFSAGRPELGRVGVQFVSDVTPYENMKIRILNGGHAVVAYTAGLLDIHFVHEAMEHPLIRRFLQKIEHEEIIPAVPPVPDMDLLEYFKKIEERFANPNVGDAIRRLCFDGSNRQPKFIIPSITDRLKEGADITGLAIESALWCRYCYGTTESGAITEPNDPNWDRLVLAARAAKDDPLAWLEMEDFYGEAGRSEVFRERFTTVLQAIWTQGVEFVIKGYVKGTL